MNNERRQFLRTAGLAAGAAALGVAPASGAPQTAMNGGLEITPVSLRAGEDHTANLQRTIDQAAASRLPVSLPAGTYRAAGLELPPGVQIAGVPGATRIVANRGRPI